MSCNRLIEKNIFTCKTAIKRVETGPSIRRYIPKYILPRSIALDSGKSYLSLTLCAVDWNVTLTSGPSLLTLCFTSISLFFSGALHLRST